MSDNDKSVDATEEAPASRSWAIKDIPWLILPMLTWLMFSAIIASLFTGLPIWLALPLGLVLGFVVFTIMVTVVGSGASTFEEMNVACGIILVLAAIMYPVFLNARKAASKERERQQLQQIRGSGASPVAERR